MFKHISHFNNVLSHQIVLQKTPLETFKSQRLLIAVLVLLVSINIFTNFLDMDTTILVGNILYVPVVLFLVSVSAFTLIKLGHDGMHGVAWISLLIASSLWLIAETTWIFYELVLHEDPFPSLADVFYSLGYPFLFVFMLAYISPVRKGITKRSLLSAISASAIILFFGLYQTIDSSFELDNETFYAVLYPILDSILIVPAFLGISLFFSGRVNFMWTMVWFGMLSLFIADTIFMYSQMDDSYYTGHPIEILFYSSYVLIAFGVYDQMRIFGQKNKIQR